MFSVTLNGLETVDGELIFMPTEVSTLALTWVGIGIIIIIIIIIIITIIIIIIIIIITIIIIKLLYLPWIACLRSFFNFIC